MDISSGGFSSRPPVWLGLSDIWAGKVFLGLKTFLSLQDTSIFVVNLVFFNKNFSPEFELQGCWSLNKIGSALVQIDDKISTGGVLEVGNSI